MIDLGPPPALHQPPPSGYEKSPSGLIVPKKDGALAMPAVFMPGLRGSGDFSLEPLASYNPNYQTGPITDSMIIPTQAMIGDLVFVIHTFAGYPASGGAGTWVNDGMGFTLTTETGVVLGSRAPIPTFRMRGAFRVLTAGQVGATVYGYKSSWRAMFVYRPSKPITNVTVEEDIDVVPHGGTTNRSVTLPLAGKGSPVISIACAMGNSGTNSFTYGPGGTALLWSGEGNTDGTRRIGHRLYNTPTSDVATANMDGHSGSLLSIWALKVSAD